MYLAFAPWCLPSISFFDSTDSVNDLQASVLAPSVKSEKKVRSILEGLCDSANRYVIEYRSFSRKIYTQE